MIFVLAMDLPVEMKRSNFGVVPFVVGEVKMIRQSLLFSCEPAIVKKKKNTKYFQKYLQHDINIVIFIVGNMYNAYIDHGNPYVHYLKNNFV